MVLTWHVYNMWNLELVSTFKEYLVALTRTTCSFWAKIWTGVSFSSLAKTKVPYVIRNELHETKNKRAKPHGAKSCLTH
jgi:hypothetical protein